MRIDQPLVEGKLVRRYKRFLTDVELPSGEVLVAHCPNTGSLLGCKEEGSPVWLRDTQDPKRKLRHSWQAVKVGETWVNVDTNLPNKVVAEALRDRRIPGLDGYDTVRTEVKYGTNSRIDVLLEDSAGALPPCYVEVKNTTLADGGVARFPDAVTTRGLKHLGELEQVVKDGARAVQFFFVSRGDVTSFEPAGDIDPDYTAGLVSAVKGGVEVVAWSTRVLPDALELDRPLEVRVDGNVVAPLA
ncbi:Sugar fermentation stimulation protein A [Planctomycetes bacterium Pla163]|uniref:Sugar fermentation stimulation protein homolog n=1 Tax=Rohdeia mirabilis TaxID=2528008 RepID=A0A518D4R2_9BACT|nr:Sugar fermentation stimulation protein A [Planctomycetes bacterium Pla163]